MVKLTNAIIFSILLTASAIAAPIERRRNQSTPLDRNYGSDNHLEVREPITGLEALNTAFNIGGAMTWFPMGLYNTIIGNKRYSSGVEGAKVAEKMLKDHHAELLAAINQACGPKPTPGTVTLTVTHCPHSATGTATSGKPGGLPPVYPNKDHVSRQKPPHDPRKGGPVPEKKKGGR